MKILDYIRREVRSLKYRVRPLYSANE